MNYQSVDEAVRQIWNYYNQKVLYASTPRTNLAKPKIVYFTKSIEVDICNEENIDKDGLNIPIPNLDYAYKVLSGITGKTIEECKKDSKLLFENNRVNTNRELFISIRIVPL